MLGCDVSHRAGPEFRGSGHPVPPYDPRSYLNEIRTFVR